MREDEREDAVQLTSRTRSLLLREGEVLVDLRPYFFQVGTVLIEASVVVAILPPLERPGASEAARH